MRLLGLDLGTKKCGIAITDSMQIIAQPLVVIFYDKQDYQYLISEIKKIIQEYNDVEKIILGITKNIDNSISNMGNITLKFQKQLENEIPNIPIILVNEKYTSKEASQILTQMNISKKKKKQSKDKIAAQKILETYMSLKH